MLYVRQIFFSIKTFLQFLLSDSLMHFQDLKSKFSRYHISYVELVLSHTFLEIDFWKRGWLRGKYPFPSKKHQ